VPLLAITTNQPLPEAGRPATLKQLSEIVAGLLDKPEQYVMVSYTHNPDMLFAGSDAPLAYLELKSIGLPGERTGELSGALATAVGEHLQVPADRVYIEFADAERHMWGWNGRTFA
jgi:phenylpyruvate tautomerase PptA (4-oxalocrotonate tautomerase family)